MSCMAELEESGLHVYVLIGTVAAAADKCCGAL